MIKNNLFSSQSRASLCTGSQEQEIREAEQEFSTVVPSFDTSPSFLLN